MTGLDEGVPVTGLDEGVPVTGLDEGVPVTGCCEVVVTASDSLWLSEFTRRLVEDRLAACGQLTERIRSIYRWQGTVHDEAEARVHLHTVADLVPAIVERARDEHPYEVPCVIAVPLSDGHPGYLDWVRRETGLGN